ncbi:uncharacterized protein CBL_12455 [Carabus blaptoides fortunei]
MAFLFKQLYKQTITSNVIRKSALKQYTTALNESKKYLEQCPNYMSLNSDWTVEHAESAQNLFNDMTVQENFLSEEEEQNLFAEIEPYLKRLRYEFDHWDDAIHGYRETERLQWNKENTNIISRLRELAFPKTVAQLKHVHILDLAPKGYIKPHIDATRFCGNTIAGMSLLSDCVMRLVQDKHKHLSADIFLKRRSLYIMKDTARILKFPGIVDYQ